MFSLSRKQALRRRTQLFENFEKCLFVTLQLANLISSMDKVRLENWLESSKMKLNNSGNGNSLANLLAQTSIGSSDNTVNDPTQKSSQTFGI